MSIRYRFYRWMYPHGRANRLARLLNRVSAVQFTYGIAAPAHWVTMEVAGRRTGRPVTCPLVVAGYRDERFLVSMFGVDANWVANVRAAGGRAVLRHGVREDVLLVEVTDGTRAAILRAYLNAAPGARPHIPVDRRAPLPAFERIAARYPVFRVTTGPTQPQPSGLSAHERSTTESA